MVSLAQVGIYGISGMVFANLVLADGGSAAAWSPWLATLAALIVATAVGLGFGAIASRSEGIYFLMITLAFSVMVFYFFSQVTQLSGFGGVNNLDLPSFIGDPVQDPVPLYYTTLIVSVLVFLALRYVSRTPFGLALQGLRDEPARMRALGFDVTRHRMLAFGLAAFVAAIAGLLSVWYNRRISPGSINLAQTIDVLIIAVVGGLFRLEGAWVGALVYALLDNYSREYTPEIGNVLGPERFNTLIGHRLPRDRPALARRPGRPLGERARAVGATKTRWRCATQSDRGGAGGRPRRRQCQVTRQRGEGEGVLRARKLLALGSAVVALGLVAGCGGDDDEPSNERGLERLGRGVGRHDQGRLPVGLRGRLRVVLRADHLRRQPGADQERGREGGRREAERRRRPGRRSPARTSRSSATAARTTRPTRRSRRRAA